MALLLAVCPDGYSGCGGVASSGVRVAPQVAEELRQHERTVPLRPLREAGLLGPRAFRLGARLSF